MNLKINGENRTFDAPSDMPLLWVLRDVLGMTGTKFGCGRAMRRLHGAYRQQTGAVLSPSGRCNR